MIFRDPRSLFLALLFVLPGGVHRVCAQTQDFRFQHITIEQGLSQSTVYAVVQDTSGFMWFGTRDGLNRYDSRKIRTYRHDLEKEHSALPIIRSLVCTSTPGAVFGSVQTRV